jgi:hypothetical protein
MDTRRSSSLVHAVAALASSLACTMAWALDAGTPDADRLALGQRIYREGILPSGQALQGVGPAGVVLSGRQAACATCHRRSGYGSSEGPIEVRSITGAALFGGGATAGEGFRSTAAAAQLSARQMAATTRSSGELARANAMALRAARLSAFAGAKPRPDYDEATLARAIREGVDVTGQVLNVAMPRYALAPSDQEALAAYLRTLSIRFSPGVDDDAVHFATVIQPGTDPQQRRALVEVLESYLQGRNAAQRSEIRREETGVVRLRRNYREWVLHVWDLSGPSDTWTRQLEAYNARQPVFAIVSGLGDASWRPIHEFSERFELPCIFPQVELPVLDGPGYYTVYLHRGLALQAQALARYLQDTGFAGTVLQVHAGDEAGRTAADALRRAWPQDRTASLSERVVRHDPTEDDWRQIAREAGDGVVVVWLPARQLGGAQLLTGAGSRIQAIYLSASSGTPARAQNLVDPGGRVRMIFPQDLPSVREARLELARRWLQSKRIAPADETVQLNGYLAATVVGLIVSHSADTYSRDFLIERLEHRLGTANEISLYPNLSLGPGQRYASKGSYIVQISGADARSWTALSDWIVP